MRSPSPSLDARANLRERGLPGRGRVVTEGRESAIVAGAQLPQRNVHDRLQYPLADFLGRLDARVGRIDHADEHHLIGLEMIADDSEDVDGIFLSSQRDEEGPGHELKQAGKQRRIVHVGTVRRIEVAAWTRVHADSPAVLGGKT